MATHNIDPTDIPDGSLYNRINFAENALLRKLREEWRKAHPQPVNTKKRKGVNTKKAKPKPKPSPSPPALLLTPASHARICLRTFRSRTSGKSLLLTPARIATPTGIRPATCETTCGDEGRGAGKARPVGAARIHRRARSRTAQQQLCKSPENPDPASNRCLSVCPGSS